MSSTLSLTAMVISTPERITFTPSIAVSTNSTSPATYIPGPQCICYHIHFAFDILLCISYMFYCFHELSSALSCFPTHTSNCTDLLLGNIYVHKTHTDDDPGPENHLISSELSLMPLRPRIRPFRHNGGAASSLRAQKSICSGGRP